MPSPQPSSHQPHPTRGARFLFTRAATEPLRYAFVIYAADGETITGELTWAASGEVAIAGGPPAGPLHVQLIKLARPLRAKAPPRMNRWRPSDGDSA